MHGEKLHLNHEYGIQIIMFKLVLMTYFNCKFN